MKKTSELKARTKGRVGDSPANGSEDINIPPNTHTKTKKEPLESLSDTPAQNKKAHVDFLIESLLKECWVCVRRPIEKIVIPKGLYEPFLSSEKMATFFHSGLQNWIPVEEGYGFKILFKGVPPEN